MCGRVCRYLMLFLDSLSAGGMAGNLLAVFSGFTYALVMMMKGFPGRLILNRHCWHPM